VQKKHQKFIRKSQLKNNFISILITNFNKSPFLNKSLSGAINQTYKNYEIIFFDDCSSDNSIEKVKNFKKIKLIKNNKKISNSAAINQINGLIEGYKKSKGDVICLMDADDVFKKNKLKIVNKYFKDNKSKIVCDFPIISKKYQFSYTKKKFYYDWPRIFPTSCISIKRKYFKFFIKYIMKSKFPYLEVDTRITIFFNTYFNEYNILNKKLTFYNYDEKGISSQIKKFSKKWWLRRSDAFDYLRLIQKRKNKDLVFNMDYILTKLIKLILKK